MRDDRVSFSAYIMLFALGIGMIGILVILNAMSHSMSVLSTEMDYINRLEMEKIDNYVLTQRDGYFLSDRYYCVWTYNKGLSDLKDIDPSFDSVNLTALHELTHKMVLQDREHYCGG